MTDPLVDPPSTLGETLRRHRLALRAQRLEQLVDVLQLRLQTGDLAPSPLRHAARDFERELQEIRGQLGRGLPV